MIIVILSIKTLDMYASNEDEYNREDDDWVLLRQTPPANTVTPFNIPFIVYVVYFICIEDSS